MTHPITPPPELVQQWCEQLFGCPGEPEINAYELARLAAEYGADQELEACCELMDRDFMAGPSDLRAARRPKPPSLKEQALAALKRYEAEEWCEEMTFDSSIIRRALEALPE
jgi:hypothetical protein